MINLALARKQNLDDITITIYKINELQMARDDIHSAMQKFGNSANKHLLREIGKFLPEIELELQKLWGFEENLNYYKFWNVPFCSCSKMDNEDVFPSGRYYINLECPVHGDK